VDGITNITARRDMIHLDIFITRSGWYLLSCILLVPLPSPHMSTNSEGWEKIGLESSNTILGLGCVRVCHRRIGHISENERLRVLDKGSNECNMTLSSVG
jgi:hypothetical protein